MKGIVFVIVLMTNNTNGTTGMVVLDHTEYKAGECAAERIERQADAHKLVGLDPAVDSAKVYCAALESSIK